MNCHLHIACLWMGSQVFSAELKLRTILAHEGNTVCGPNPNSICILRVPYTVIL